MHTGPQTESDTADEDTAQAETAAAVDTAAERPTTGWRRLRQWSTQAGIWASVLLLSTPLIPTSLMRVGIGAAAASALAHGRLWLRAPLFWCIAFSVLTLVGQLIRDQQPLFWEDKRAPLYFWAPLLLIAALPLRVRPHLQTIVRITYLGCLYATILVLLQAIFGWDIDNRPFRIAWNEELWSGLRPRVSGSGNHWMTFGVFYAMAALALVHWRRWGWFGPRLNTAIALLLWLPVAVFNKTRMAIATFLVLLPFGFQGWRLRWRLLLLSVILLGGSLGFLALAQWVPGWGDRLDIMRDGRFSIWNNAASIFETASWWGHGPTAYETEVRAAFPDLPEWRYISHPHNTILGVGIAFGWFPLLVYLGSQLVLLWHCWRQGSALSVSILAMYHGCGLLDYMLWNSHITLLAYGLIAVDLALCRSDPITYRAGLQGLPPPGDSLHADR